MFIYLFYQEWLAGGMAVVGKTILESTLTSTTF